MTFFMGRERRVVEKGFKGFKGFGFIDKVPLGDKEPHENVSQAAESIGPEVVPSHDNGVDSEKRVPDG